VLLCLFCFRAVYKLRGTEKGLNFPLSEEKAELDLMSKAEFLAQVEVEKEQGRWSRIHGASKYRGVEKRRTKWIAYVAKGVFTTRQEAAAAYAQVDHCQEWAFSNDKCQVFWGQRRKGGSLAGT